MLDAYCAAKQFVEENDGANKIFSQRAQDQYNITLATILKKNPLSYIPTHNPQSVKTHNPRPNKKRCYTKKCKESPIQQIKECRPNNMALDQEICNLISQIEELNIPLSDCERKTVELIKSNINCTNTEHNDLQCKDDPISIDDTQCKDDTTCTNDTQCKDDTTCTNDTQCEDDTACPEENPYIVEISRENDDTSLLAPEPICPEPQCICIDNNNANSDIL